MTRFFNGTDFGGPISKYIEARSTGSIEQVKLFLKGIIDKNSNQILLPHPTRYDVVTYCNANVRHWMSNLLFFCDQYGGHRWCLIQDMNFIDAVFLEGDYHSLYSPNSGIGPATAEFIRREDLMIRAFEQNRSFGGFLLEQNRPFHYFYDHLSCLVEMYSDQFFNDINVNVGNKVCFYNPTRIMDLKITAAQDDKYYIFPNMIGGIEFMLQNRGEFYRTANIMENLIRSRTNLMMVENGSNYDLILWIGITGQKRYWLEQVSGYASIIKELKKSFDNIKVFVDGLTAGDGGRLHVHEDIEVFRSIEDIVGSDATMISLVGMDYVSKIACCNTCDFFITNSGSGTIVPLRFCRIPGVIHSNTKLQLFENAPYNFTVRQVGEEQISLSTHSEHTREDNISYHLHWQAVYNELCAIIQQNKAIELQRLNVPGLDLLGETHYEIFGKLSKNSGASCESWRLLYEAARCYKKIGDFATAIKLFEQSLNQMPDYAFIRNELECLRKCANYTGFEKGNR